MKQNQEEDETPLVGNVHFVVYQWLLPTNVTLKTKMSPVPILWVLPAVVQKQENNWYTINVCLLPPLIHNDDLF